jgi:hypothetical protein
LAAGRTRELAIANVVKAWQCIGCGKIEALQTCVGVCQDRRVEFVYAFEHEQTLAKLASALTRVEELEALACQLAWTKPRPGEWEHSYRALQLRARRILALISVKLPRSTPANVSQPCTPASRAQLTDLAAYTAGPRVNGEPG